MTGHLPHFLIVGAMKGGTTTLYYDLGDHPELHLPAYKEPEILMNHRGGDEIRRAYGLHFRNAQPGQLCGEASTGYTKRPDHEGVAQRALDALGSALRIVYIRREPVARALSQYRHELQQGTVTGDFDQAVRTESRFIDYSRYDWQIAPWRTAFGDANVFEIELEEYSRNKGDILLRLLAFLGADPTRLGEVDRERKANSVSELKAIGSPLLRGIVMSGFYQHQVKPIIPRRFREMARRLILPKPDTGDIGISPETREFILSQLRRPK